MLDTIGGANMVQGSSTTFTSDRFGCLNAALALNEGFTKVPSGIYFNTPQFTISVWVYPQQIHQASRILDFGNGQNSNNVLLALASGKIPVAYFNIYSGSVAKVPTNTSPFNLTMGVWQFITATYNGAIAQIYLNGEVKGNKTVTFVMPSILRNNCYIGKSNWIVDGNSTSYIDDLRFYNVSLTQMQIVQLMNQNISGSNFLLINTLNHS